MSVRRFWPRQIEATLRIPTPYFQAVAPIELVRHFGTRATAVAATNPCPCQKWDAAG